jgi:uncharacterized membrane protein YgcG
MKQGIEQIHTDKQEPKRENFSKNEKRIAKCGLVVAILTAVIYALYQSFPENPMFATAFACFGPLVLIIAGLCVLTKPAEITATGVKKAAKMGMIYAKRLSKKMQSQKPILTAAFNRVKISCRARTNARSYRSPSRSRFAFASSSSGGNSSDDDGSGSDGDPPGHEHPVTPQTLPEKPNRKPHPWRTLGSCRAPFCTNVERGRLA